MNFYRWQSFFLLIFLQKMWFLWSYSSMEAIPLLGVTKKSWHKENSNMVASGSCDQDVWQCHRQYLSPEFCSSRHIAPAWSFTQYRLILPHLWTTGTHLFTKILQATEQLAGQTPSYRSHLYVTLQIVHVWQLRAIVWVWRTCGSAECSIVLSCLCIPSMNSYNICLYIVSVLDYPPFGCQIILTYLF